MGLSYFDSSAQGDLKYEERILTKAEHLSLLKSRSYGHTHLY